MARVRKLALLLLLVALGPATSSAGDEPAAFADRVRLKSGTLLRGRVLESLSSQGGPLLRVETNGGEILVPKVEVEGVDRAAPETTGALTFQELWVVGLRGEVQRKPQGVDTYETIAWNDARYASQGSRPATSLVRPGDTIRTGKDGQLDLMPTPDIWLRIGPASEVELPPPAAQTTLRLLRGSLLQRVTKRPSTAPIVVAQPSLILGVRGTFFRCVVGDDEHVQVLEGTIEIEGRDAVTGGRAVTRRASGEVSQRELTETERQAFRVALPTPVRESMVYIRGGKVLFKTPPRDPWPAPTPYGRPARVETTIPDYLIERYEVTNGEFATFAEATGASVPAHFVGRRPRPGSEDHPVYGLSRDLAEAYAHWCGKELPTDAQWEHAARGPDNHLFPWGEDPSVVRELPIGAWSTSAEGSWVWDPPSGLAAVRSPTADSSWSGVMGLVSGPPEWTQEAFRSGPLFDPRGLDKEAGKDQGCLRGLATRYASTVFRHAAPPAARAGGVRLAKALR